MPSKGKQPATSTLEVFGDLPSRVVVNRQVHSNRIVNAPEAPLEADGLTTLKNDVALCVFTADCVPVLIAEPERGACAALHAGWRGLANGIITAYGRDAGNLSAATAWIGPSIGACCYEVSERVASQVARKSGTGVVVRPVSRRLSANGTPAADGSPRGSSRPYLDLTRAAMVQLRELGIEDIRLNRICTRCSSHWHSYRREGPGRGRNHAFIWRSD